MAEVIQAAAATLPIWRDSAIAVLAFIVIAALYLYATLLEP